MITQIVANSFVLKNFSKIDIFKRELGDNLTGAVNPNSKDDMTIKISDDFIKRYKANTGNIIFRYGSIGKITFYQDQNLKNNEFAVFDDNNKIYEINIEDSNYLLNNPKKYLSEIIKKIDEAEKQPDDENYISTVPEGVEKPDISLPKDQYIEKMANRRNEISKLPNDDEHLAEIIKKRKQQHYNK